MILKELFFFEKFQENKLFLKFFEVEWGNELNFPTIQPSTPTHVIQPTSLNQLQNFPLNIFFLFHHHKCFKKDSKEDNTI